MTTNGGLEAAKTPLRHLNAQSTLKHARVSRLEQELQQAVEEKDTLNQIYRKQLIRCARADCLQLTKMMHDKLPAELREIIYHYLCIEEPSIPVGPYYHFRKYESAFRDLPPDEQVSTAGVEYDNTRFEETPFLASYAAVADVDDRGDIETSDSGGDVAMFSTNTDSDDEDIDFEDHAILLPGNRVKHDHSHKPPSDILMPNSHVLNPRYVGPSIGFEIQKVYYSNNTFSICNVERGIYNFLHLDTRSNFKKWENGHPPRIPRDTRLYPWLAPAHCVRNLQVRAKFEQFESNMPENLTEGEEYAYERHFLRFGYSNMYGLKKLSGEPPQRELNIEFIIMTELQDLGNNLYHDDRRFINFLQSIRNTVYRLMHDREGTKVKVTHHDEMASPFPRDLTGLFALSKEQWECEKAAHIGQADWIADFYLAPAPLEPKTLCGGFSGREIQTLLRERWGIDSVLDTKCKYPIKEGKYWPVGNGHGPGWV